VLCRERTLSLYKHPGAIIKVLSKLWSAFPPAAQHMNTRCVLKFVRGRLLSSDTSPKCCSFVVPAHLCCTASISPAIFQWQSIYMSRLNIICRLYVKLPAAGYTSLFDASNGTTSALANLHFGLPIHFVASPELHGRFKHFPDSHSTIQIFSTCLAMFCASATFTATACSSH
jgi:hypothetical protein